MNKPTDEQKLAVEQALKGDSFKIMAYAGAGKTSTLRLIGNYALANKKGIYLAFNKAIAEEAQTKFDRGNIECKTFHSLAFRGVPKWLTAKMKNNRVWPDALVKIYDLPHFKDAPIKEIKVKKNEKPCRDISARDVAVWIENTVANFTKTNDPFITVEHFKNPDWLDDENNEYAKSLVDLAQKHWDDLITEGNSFKIGHDVYLKYWAMNSPFIPANFILFDEAQDADPLILSVMAKQKHAQLIYVGDRHQQIYGWRGAVNAMQDLDMPCVRLTQSFRFGENVAACANLILTRVLGETAPLIGFDIIKDQVSLSKLENPDAILCRTNGNAFAVAVAEIGKKRRVKLEMDTAAIKKFIEACVKLQNKQNQDHPDLDGFEYWSEVLTYIKEYPKADIAPMVNLMVNHDPVMLIHAANASSEKDYDVVVCTAHKSKGLEWDHVELSNDFKFSILDGAIKISDDEARLIYVAMTRAKKTLDVSAIPELFIALNWVETSKAIESNDESVKKLY